MVPGAADQPIGFYFTLGAYCQYGSLGIEHRVKYNPGLVDEMDGSLVKELGKFKDELIFSADDIKLFFTELTQRVDLITRKEFAEVGQCK